MKNLFYLLTIGGLLWLFFNPSGILTYNAKSNEVRQLNKKEKKHKLERDKHKISYRWLEEFKNSIESKDLEKQKQILEKYGPEIGLQLILRNFFKEGFEVLNIKNKKGP